MLTSARGTALTSATRPQIHCDAPPARVVDATEGADGFGLKPATKISARQGLIAKRLFNCVFRLAQQSDPSLNFQTFAAVKHQVMTFGSLDGGQSESPTGRPPQRVANRQALIRQVDAAAVAFVQDVVRD